MGLFINSRNLESIYKISILKICKTFSLFCFSKNKNKVALQYHTDGLSFRSFLFLFFSLTSFVSPFSFPKQRNPLSFSRIGRVDSNFADFQNHNDKFCFYFNNLGNARAGDLEKAQKAYGATHVAHKFKSLPHPPEKNPYSITPETLSSYLSLTPNSGMGIQPGVSLTLHSLSDSGNFITFLFFFQRMHFSLPLHCYSRVREGSCLCGV